MRRSPIGGTFEDEAPDSFTSTLCCINDLALETCSLSSVLTSILRLFFGAPITAHTFHEICTLLHASAKGPPDVGYLLLAIAVCLHAQGVTIRASIARSYVKFLISLLRSPRFFVTFESEQRKANGNLVQFARLFTSHPCSYSLPDIDNDHWGVDRIIRYLNLLEFLPWKFGPLVEPECKSVCSVSDTGSNTVPDLRELHELAFGNGEVDETVLRLAGLFTSWVTVYDATKEVWSAIESGQLVAIDSLMSRIPLPYAYFLTEGIRKFRDWARVPSPFM
jgi:hypothetical protein